MIIVLKPTATEEQLRNFTEKLKSDYNVRVNKWDGVQSTVLGLIGDTTAVDIEYIDAQDIVESVKRVQEPYKKANRKFHPDNTVIKISDTVSIGDGSLHIMAGPCSVESEEQIVGIAKDIKASGATLLRGGAFKPRTSPYAFQGLKAEGLDLLKIARKETGLPIVTEIMRTSHIDMFENVDIIQVGARNMQNFELLKELGKTNKPILLKRGLSATIEEWLMSAEYIMAGGNDKVMLCEQKHARRFGYPDRQKALASSGHRRSQPRLGQVLACRTAGYGGGCRRRRRTDNRGSQRSATRALGRRTVADPGAV